MSDRIRTAPDTRATQPSPGHYSMWKCDGCGASSGVFAGRKQYRAGWLCAGCWAAMKGRK